MDVTINGAMLETEGFTDFIEIEGVGLLTRGFVKLCDGDWIQPLSINTSWSQPAGITTIWAGSSNAIFGDC